MNEDIQKLKTNIDKINSKVKEFLWKKNIKSKIEELDNIINSENFWSDKKNAENVIKEKNNLTSW